MENKDLKVSFKTVMILVLVSAPLFVFGGLSKIMHWPLADLFMYTGMIFLCSSWVIVISDISEQKLGNKFFWIFSMFLFPVITPVIYLLRRSKLIGN